MCKSSARWIKSFRINHFETRNINVTELVAAIEGKPKPKEIVLEAHLVRRGSVAKLRKG